MDYQATSKYLRVSPRKVRLVADAVRKMRPAHAAVSLAGMNKRAAQILLEVLNSAMANANKKSGVGSESLKFSKIEVMGGPVMKRWQAVSRGTAHSIKKRMTHIRIVLTESTNARILKEEKS